ncbi:MAG: hypothetical protein ABWY29_02890 [Blastococcus sp.]
MNAAVLRETGGPPVYADVDEPVAGEGQVVVEMAAAAIHHVDRRDAYRQLTEHAAKGDIAVAHEEVPLAEVASSWDRQRAGAGTKLVLVP